ncbi:MAG: NIPSNAP family protein [Burkholderiales bacterium]|nr:NIPSNAP family protein [Burkholderiales bacterium]
MYLWGAEIGSSGLHGHFSISKEDSKRIETVNMIIEERVYAIEKGRILDFLNLYQAEGMAVQKKHSKHMVGFFYEEGDKKDTLVQLWGFVDLDDKAASQSAMQSDPAWKDYVAKIKPLILDREVRVMKCAPFFSGKLERLIHEEII